MVENGRARGQSYALMQILLYAQFLQAPTLCKMRIQDGVSTLAHSVKWTKEGIWIDMK